jgi:autotransporter-associated beta strand protein
MWPKSILIVAGTVALIHYVQPSVHAITINMEYTDEGDPTPHPENPSWDPDGTILKNHFNAAKAIWEALLPGGGEYSFDFHWDNDIDALGQYTPGIDEYIEINPDYDWFADPDPLDNAEFNAGAQNLYSGLTPSERTTYFPGTAPPIALEVGFRAAGLSNGTLVNGVPANTLSASGQVIPGTTIPVDASSGTDLLSVILHEIGHALGISGIEPGEYNIFPQHVGGSSNVLVLEHPDSGHLADDANTPGYLMNPFTPSGTRVFPTATDVLVIAEDQGITVVQLARVGRIANGAWSDANNWIGGDNPDGTQDVYIAHGGSVTLDVDTQVKNLQVAAGNTLAVSNRRLSASGTINFAGAMTVGAGGTLAADNFVGDSSGLTSAAGSLVRFNSFESATSANVANFGGSVAIGQNTGSSDPVTFGAADNSIKTWLIGGDLDVGDERNATLVVNNETWNVIGNFQVQGSGGFSEVALEQNGNLFVGGTITVGTYGRLFYRTGKTASNTTYQVQGGSTVVVSPPLPEVPHLSHTPGGVITFDGTANSADAQFTLYGGAGDDAPAGIVVFSGDAAAGNDPPETASPVRSEFRMKGGRRGPTLPVGAEIAGDGGQVRFENNSRANTALFINEGGAEYIGGTGGRTIFTSISRAERSIIHNHGTAYMNGDGGATLFFDNSSANNASITNHADGSSTTLHPAASARTIYHDFSSAASATIENLGGTGQLVPPGRTEFRGNSRASNATIHNRGHILPGGAAGRTDFFDNATADSATIHIYEGYSDAGRVEFHNNASAETARIFVNNVPTILGSSGNGGHVVFRGSSTAASSQITLRQDACCNGIQFFDSATAAETQVTQEDRSGTTVFWGHSKAGHGTFLIGNETGINFRDQSQAEQATISMANRARLNFFESSSAGDAHIVLAGATAAGPTHGGGVHFNSPNSTAANSTIIATGGTAPGAVGGLIEFNNGAQAGNATITLNSSINGGSGALLTFNGGAEGNNAELTANAGAVVDFLDQRNFGNTAVGSIAGAGTYMLRGSLLTTGTRNTSTTVLGSIVDATVAGGRLTKVGTGSLTLAGTNTYSGLTTVNGGTLSITGSIAGGAVVNDGGTLQGLGTIGGLVTVNAGGILAPGTSPGTLTIGGLAMLPGSTLNFEIGNPQRDHVVISGGGAVSLSGTLNVSLLDGFTPTLGQSFPLFEGAIGSITGTFNSINVPTFNGLTFDIVQDAGSILLQVGEAANIPGDFNNDGTVDAADYVMWRKTNSLPTGYNTWRMNFGRTAGSGSASDATVPEPAAALSFVLAAGMGCWRRCRLHSCAPKLVEYDTR